MTLGTFITLATVAGAWLAYGILHSALAATRTKGWVARRWPRLYPRYRAVYNVTAAVTLLPMLWLLYTSQTPHAVALAGRVALGKRRRRAARGFGFYEVAALLRYARVSRPAHSRSGHPPHFAVAPPCTPSLVRAGAAVDLAARHGCRLAGELCVFDAVFGGGRAARRKQTHRRMGRAFS